LELGRWDDARASFACALTIRPDFANAHNNLGNAFRGLNHLDKALASYDRALAINPRYAEALCNRGIVLRSPRTIRLFELNR
jgi:lipoprotein NlpI